MVEGFRNTGPEPHLQSCWLSSAGFVPKSMHFWQIHRLLMLLSEYQALRTTAVDPICSPLLSSARFPRWLTGKEIVCQSGDSGLIPGSGRSPREGHGNPLQYSCLRNPMDSLAGYSPWGCKRIGQDSATQQQQSSASLSPAPGKAVFYLCFRL